MSRIKTLLVLLIFFTITAAAQRITGIVLDETTGDSIPYASITYKGHRLSYVSDVNGHFKIERHNGWYATFSAVGYQSLRLLISTNTPDKMHITLKPDTKKLSGVTVKTKKKKYRRKNNPAVELMKRVVAAKKKTDLDNHDFYKYDKYQKMTVAINDITAKDLVTNRFRKSKWMINQVEQCQYNEKMILPVLVDETVSENLYRKDPHSEKVHVIGQNTNGVNKFFETGDLLTTVVKDVFTPVDIYDNQVRLLHRRFNSPICDGATQFYRYYIVDTVKVDNDSCYHLEFTPPNQQDVGFSGELWIVKDSTLHVKRCIMRLPSQTGVNFVDAMQVRQEFQRLENGEWALSQDDMVVEMSLLDFLTKGIVIRNIRLDNYSFDPIEGKKFKGKQREKYDPDAQIRDNSFWTKYRSVPLTRSEARMDQFLKDMENAKGFKIILWGFKALVENFIETGDKEHPSKVDIGPVNTMVTSNFIDGVRTRISGQTTANLNPHWFASGYYARGWDSKKNYYKGELTYSFNKKHYAVTEYPVRTVAFSSTYDVCSPSDKFVKTDKDNVFTSLKWSEVNKMMFYNRQQLKFDYEMEGGLKTSLYLKAEENEACGELKFIPLSMDASSMGIGKIRTTEATVMLRFAPGENVVNTKQHRVSVNHDIPVFTLSHTFGVKGVLGGDYNYNFTEASIYKRLWLHSWGRMDVRVKGGVQWNQVPYPLLIMPAANLSYVVSNETFNMVNNMEFLNDRYASLDIAWDLNGKILNRIPLIKKLKWREYVGFKCLWGSLSDKNNPYLERNAGNSLLMHFPEGAYVMDSNKPYSEFIFGIGNIFKFFQIQYVRRLSYLNLPTAKKNGIRVAMRFSF